MQKMCLSCFAILENKLENVQIRIQEYIKADWISQNLLNYFNILKMKSLSHNDAILKKLQITNFNIF